MNQSEFEADLRREGYQVFYGGLQAGTVNADHSHDWDARVMVIGGEITLTRGGKAETFRAGDSCAVARAKFTPSTSARKALPISPGGATQGSFHNVILYLRERHDRVPDALECRRQLDVLHAKLGERIHDRIRHRGEPWRDPALATAAHAERVRRRRHLANLRIKPRQQVGARQCVIQQ